MSPPSFKKVESVWNVYRNCFRIVKRGGVIVSMLEKPDERLMNETGVKAVLLMTRVERKVLEETPRSVRDEGT